MTDTPGVSPNVVSVTEAQLRTQRFMRELKAHAAVAADGAESAEMRTALKRLGRILASDQPLRANVPRGFYLSFNV
ncbi:MAG: hypothetical protein AAB223_03055 [Pseudomonadota bacterium]